MTTVLDRAEPVGTHVLAIGVSIYDHLIDGPETKTMLDNPYGLKQLGSPAISARTFAEWTLNDLNNPDAPLASVEVVISAKPEVAIQVPGQGSIAIESATRGNIQNAFNRWYARLNTHADNVGIFYHCGHGLESSDLALLAQDFGAPGGDPPNLWANAYNFHRTYRGMARCKARAQFFLIDACRQVSADSLEFESPDVPPLIDPKLRGLNSSRNAPIIYATEREQKAFADPTKVSTYTAAVLEALNNNGARRIQGTWRVSNVHLPQAVRSRMRLRCLLEDVPVQRPKLDGETTDESVIHELSAPPKIPAFVASDNPDFPTTTQLEFRHNNTVSASKQGSGPWLLEVPANVYDVVAMDGTTQLGQADDGWVNSPEYTGRIR